MSKKKLSLVVILCTIFSVALMIFSDKINLKKEIPKDKIEVIKGNTDNKVNAVNNAVKNDLNNTESKKSSTIEKSDTGSNKINTYNHTEKYKNFKMDTISQQIREDKNVFLSSGENSDYENKNPKNTGEKKDTINEGMKENNQHSEEKSSNESESSNSNSSKDVPVFKIAKSKVKDSLTFSDKEKLLFIASKLSVVDYDKINKYLQNGSDEDIKNTIKLLKERLSDKDYEKVKEVAEKFINMDSIEQ